MSQTLPKPTLEREFLPFTLQDVRPANKNFTHSCLTFANFYAGIGGFRLGLEQIGWQCVFSNEN
ncbi:MAG: DNA cytosine methyltransferase, partial [Microcystis panniformis]